MEEFNDDEIETVLAHKLGHHVNKDIPVGILISSVVTLGRLYQAHLVLLWRVAFFGFEGAWDVAALPLFMLVIGLYGLVTMPLSNAYSRWWERRADEYALQATGKGQAYASALARLANQNLADADPKHPLIGCRRGWSGCCTRTRRSVSGLRWRRPTRLQSSQNCATLHPIP